MYLTIQYHYTQKCQRLHMEYSILQKSPVLKIEISHTTFKLFYEIYITYFI